MPDLKFIVTMNNLATAAVQQLVGQFGQLAGASGNVTTNINQANTTLSATGTTTSGLARQLDSLRSSVDAAYRAQSQLSRANVILGQSVSAGLISQKEADRVITQVTTKYDQNTQAIARNAQAQDRMAASAQKYRDMVSPVLAVQRAWGVELDNVHRLVEQQVLDVSDASAAIQRLNQTYQAQINNLTGVTAAAEKEARALRDARTAADALRDRIDVLGAAQRKFAADMQSAQGLLAKGLISPQELAAEEARLRKVLEARQQALTGGTRTTTTASPADSLERLRLANDVAYRNSLKLAEAEKILSGALAAGNINLAEKDRLLKMVANNLDMAASFGTGAGRSMTALAGTWKLNQIGLLQLQAAGVNTFQALAAGMNPLQVAVMEGAQVIGSFVQGGHGWMSLLSRLVSPLSLVTMGVVALTGVTAVAVAGLFRQEQQLRRFAVALQGVNSVAGATPKILQESARWARTLGMSYSEAAKGIEELARNPAFNLTGPNSRRALQIGADLGATLLIGQEEGLKRFTEALSGGPEQLIELAEKLKNVTNEELIQIKVMRDLGVGADVLSNKLVDLIAKATEGNDLRLLSESAKAWRDLGVAFAAAWRAFVDSPPIGFIAVQLTNLTREVTSLLRLEIPENSWVITLVPVLGNIINALSGIQRLRGYLPGGGDGGVETEGRREAPAAGFPRFPGVRSRAIDRITDPSVPLSVTVAPQEAIDQARAERDLAAAIDLAKKAEAGRQEMLAKLPKEVQNAIAALEKLRRENLENAATERLRGSQQAAQQAYLDTLRAARLDPARRERAEELAHEAKRAVLEKAAIDLAKQSQEARLIANESLKTAAAFARDHAAGLRAAAQAQAELAKLQEPRVNVREKTQEILRGQAAESLKALTEQVPANNRLVEAQERLAQATQRGSAAAKQQEIENETALKTEELLVRARDLNNEQLERAVLAYRQLLIAQGQHREASSQTAQAFEAVNQATRQLQQVQLETMLVGSTPVEAARAMTLLQGAQQLADRFAYASEEAKNSYAGMVAELANAQQRLALVRQEQQRMEEMVRGIAGTIENSIGRAMQDAFDGKKVQDLGATIKQMFTGILTQITMGQFVRPLIGTGLRALGFDNVASQYGTLGGTTTGPEARGEQVRVLAEALQSTRNVQQMDVQAATVNLQGALANLGLQGPTSVERVLGQASGGVVGAGSSWELSSPTARSTGRVGSPAQAGGMPPWFGDAPLTSRASVFGVAVDVEAQRQALEQFKQEVRDLGEVSKQAVTQVDQAKTSVDGLGSGSSRAADKFDVAADASAGADTQLEAATAEIKALQLTANELQARAGAVDQAIGTNANSLNDLGNSLTTATTQINSVRDGTTIMVSGLDLAKNSSVDLTSNLGTMSAGMQGAAQSAQSAAGSFANAGSAISSAAARTASSTISLSSAVGTVASALNTRSISGGGLNTSSLMQGAGILDKLFNVSGSSGTSSIWSQGGALFNPSSLFSGGSSSGGMFSGVSSFLDSGLGGIFAGTSPGAVTSTALGSWSALPTATSGLFGNLTLGGAFNGIGMGFGAGSFLNSLMGGNKLFGSVGSGLGSVAGTLVGGPIGGLIGGALGGLLGGLFGNNKPRNASAGGGFDLSTGRLTGTFQGGNSQIDQSTLQALEQLAGGLAILKTIPGNTLAGQILFQNGVNTGTTVDWSGLTGVSGFEGSGRMSLGKDPAAGALQIFETISRGLTGVSDTVRKIIDNTTDLTKLAENLQFAAIYEDIRLAFEDAFANLPGERQLGPFQQAMNQITATFDEITAKAQEFALELEPIDAALAEATKRLQVDFTTFLEQGLLESMGRGFINQLQAVYDATMVNIQDSQAIGLGDDPATKSLIDQLYQEQLNVILGGLDKTQLDQVIEHFTGLNDAIVLLAENAQPAAAALSAATKSLRDLLAELTRGQLSGKNPADLFAAAQVEFNRVLTLVQGGDSSQYDALAAAGGDVIRLGQEAYGNAPNVEAVRQAVIQAINSILAGSFASGTASTPPGLILTGERGRELIMQPGGLQVLSNRDTERVLSSVAFPAGRSFADGTLVVNDNMSSRELVAAVRRLEEQLAAVNAKLAAGVEVARAGHGETVDMLGNLAFETQRAARPTILPRAA